jgi:heterodisulfide reductase subunit C
MDVLPSTLMRLAQLGQMEVLDSQTIWKCSSCFNCSARCPRSIDVAKIIESLRQLNLRKKIDHIQIKDIPKEEISILPQLALIANLRKFTA